MRRREFLAAASSRVLGANSRINTGHIGVGERGFRHFRDLASEHNDVQVLAVCDVYSRRRDRARRFVKDVYLDYREMLNRSDIDAVFIATPDHWHARMAVDAMAAGKDVYLEMPVSLTIPEARAVRDAAKRYGRILQVGAQGVSDPRYRQARQLIENGEVGELLWAQAAESRNSYAGEWNEYVEEEGTPENIDWKRWLGPAKERPFSAERFFRWRKYWDYSGGIATTLLYDKLGSLSFAMGPQFPIRVTGSGGIFVQRDREVPDTYSTTIEYPNFAIQLSASTANAAISRFVAEAIYGHKGTLLFEPGKVVLIPERIVANNQPRTFEVSPADTLRAHRSEFLQCVRSRTQPVMNGDFAYQAMVAIWLGVSSYRDGKTKFFDAKTGQETAVAPKRLSFEGDASNRPDGIPKPQ